MFSGGVARGQCHGMGKKRLSRVGLYHVLVWHFINENKPPFSYMMRKILLHKNYLSMSSFVHLVLKVIIKIS